jgi:hypothetical protein
MKDTLEAYEQFLIPALPPLQGLLFPHVAAGVLIIRPPFLQG